jgi:hypothetical protein
MRESEKSFATHVLTRAWHSVTGRVRLAALVLLLPAARARAQKASDTANGLAKAVVGTWTEILTDPSGVGLYTQFDLRSDGTYAFLSVIKTKYSCGGDGSIIEYSGRYHVAGWMLEVSPTAGKRGCSNHATVLSASQMSTNPGIGNHASHVRLVDGRLCLRLGDDSHETCIPRAPASAIKR